MAFEEAYRKWMETHLRERKGERLRRLKEGHGYGEKLLLQEVWWPVLGNLDFLHPEYEFVDEDGNYYYLDLAYLRLPKPTALEADGFGPHAREADRRTFKGERRRQNASALSGWNILRFSVDDLQEDPAHGRRTLTRMLERWYGEESQTEGLPLYMKEIVRLLTQMGQPVTPVQVCRHLGISDKYARALLRQLVKDSVLEVGSGARRIRSYRLKQKK